MNKAVKILLVEDNEGDIILAIEALKEANITNVMHVSRDGEEALGYLRKQGRYKNAETPDLILLDINLPGLNGNEVLAEIKKDEALLIIPVVMLTTSDSEKDIMESYQNHANCYITKPAEFEKFTHVMNLIKDFWFSIVQLPNTTKFEQSN